MRFRYLLLLVILVMFPGMLNAQDTIRWDVSSAGSGTVSQGPRDRIATSGRISFPTDIFEAPHGKSVGSVPRGSVVYVYKLSPDNNWYQISFNNVKGYVPSHVVVLDSPIQGSNNGASDAGSPNWNVADENTEPDTSDVSGTSSGSAVTVNTGIVIPEKPLPPPVPVAKKPDQPLIKMPGYTTADCLNVRNGPWGEKIGTLPSDSPVKIIGQEGEWFKVEYNGGTAYLHSKYVMLGNRKMPVPGGSVSGNAELGKKLVATSKAYIGSTDFRGADVAYGRLACAKFVSTVLHDNKVIPVVLNVRTLVSELKKKGWVEVTPPPYKDGDVITWKTYDYTGDGIKDPDSHVGIVNVKPNGVYAIHNSSTRKYPRETNVNFGAPICRVLRAP